MEGYFKRMLQMMGVVFLVISANGNSMQGSFNFCTLSCQNDEVSHQNSHPTSSPTARLIRGKSGPRGEKGARGHAGAKGEAGISYNRSEMDKLQARISQLESNLTNSRDEVSDLQTRISQLESQLISMRRINKIVQKAIPNKWEFCGAGVQSASIVADDQLTASTSASTNPPRNARLLGKVGGNGVWCPNSKQANDWIQVDFEQEIAISGVVTQGYHRGGQRVTSYKVSYQRTNEGFTTITDQSGSVMVFQGNEDSNTPVAHDFPTEITARYFRIIVVTWNVYPCLRFDYLTC